jgi:hypothetical protein
MALASSLRDLGTEAIEEYLDIADYCVRTRKGSGSGIYGYPAALLLLCVVDAIGQSFQGPSRHTELSVLANPLANSLFGLTLTTHQTTKLANWYRHKLAHAAIMTPGVYLTSEFHGPPFVFNTEIEHEPIEVRLPVLANIVRAAWNAHKPAFSPALRTGDTAPDVMKQPSGFTSTLSPAASGTT